MYIFLLKKGGFLDIVHQKSGDVDLSRTNSQIELSGTCSTMSIVHLQEKYESNEMVEWRSADDHI